MNYKITQLSKDLYYIRWYTSPEVGSPAERAFLDELKNILEETENPVYFLSDLRQGRISNHEALRKLGKLAEHQNWAGSTAFSQNPLTSMFVDVFSRFTKQSRREDEIWESPQDAIAYLETQKPSITEGIDWEQVLADDPTE